MPKRIILLTLFILILPVLCSAGPTIPGFYGNVSPPIKAPVPNALPTLKPGVPLQGATSPEPAPGSNQRDIYQNQPKAIINWQTFDIGSGATVNFYQRDAQGKPQSDWAALNRIWDRNPSQIFGRMTADGQVYLINQNGIVFGPGSQINVHSLIASSLNIQNNDFLAGILKFKAENYNGLSDNVFYDSLNNIPGVVSNHGTIQTDSLGSVFLIGSQVENSGAVISPIGQIGLVAGADLELALPISPSGQGILTYPGGEPRTTRVVKMYNSPVGSTASNLAGGYLAADSGVVGMYGRIVNQDGVIRSVTAVQRGSHVELLASDAISTGPNSKILLPVDSSSNITDSSFQTQRSNVTLSGLDPANPSDPQVYPNLVLHQGAIMAPSALVTMNAVNRVYLAPASLIDVSGLWVDKSAAAGVMSLQMNTVNLRDNFSQKGAILQGQTVALSQLSGSAIGDISGVFSTQGSTAADRHTAGGEVDIKVTGSVLQSGDVVMMQGSTINFSGGGIRYAAGYVDTTKMVSGTHIYDISSASPDIQYDRILNSQTVTYRRFGITERYNGVYYGGASPLLSYVPAYTVGANAGIFSIIAPQTVLDGTLLSRAINGLQQTLASNPVNGTGNQSASGYIEAAGGTLKIGATDVTNGGTLGDRVDFVTRNIEVNAQGTILPATFQPSDTLSLTTTVLSAATLSNARLSNLSIAANTTITVDKGASLRLNAGGTFNAKSRRIENYGTILALGGNISLTLQTNVTSNPIPDGAGNPTNPRYIPLREVICLGEGSSLIARGERIDNSGAASSSLGIRTSGHINGGSINVQEQTVTGEGVFLLPGALIDVSGGWKISASGEVTGGDAGKVVFQGSSLVLNGDLLGRSLLGNKGGSISLTAPNIVLADSPGLLPGGFKADDAAPQDLLGRLVLGSGQLDATGFTNVTLKSVNDIVIKSGGLGPSLVKLSNPLAGGSTQGVAPGLSSLSPTGSGIFLASQDQIEASGVTLIADVSASVTAGQSNPSGNGLLAPSNPNPSAKIWIGPEASVKTSPGGSITMTAVNVDIAGLLSSPAGTITLLSQQGAYLGDLTLQPSSKILAEGYNRMTTVAAVKGLSAQVTPLSAGSITLTAGRALNLSPGSLVSVSGSSPVQQAVVGNDGGLSFIMVAGAPGAINLSGPTINGLSGEQNGVLAGHAYVQGLQGGTLSVNAGTLALQIKDLARLSDEGFDSVSLISARDLNLSGSGTVFFGRDLTLSAARIAGPNSGADQLTLGAPWVKLTGNSNTSRGLVLESGAAQITLDSTWLDIAGIMGFSGFSSVQLKAARDMTFTDRLILDSYQGLLRVSGDLTLQAARIYPTALSRFTIDTTSAGAPYGTVTILPSGARGGNAIYSAGGSLTIRAGGAGIDQEGMLAAPMGTIFLQANATGGRVYLAPGSVTTTRGSDVPVPYGVIQLASDTFSLGDNVWAVPAKDNVLSAPYVAVKSAPLKSIQINAGEVIVREGATIDISGGGSVLATRFIPSYSGTNNPLTGSWVILPDNSVTLPGKGVYLPGAAGIPAGTYSLLPATDAIGNPTAYVYLPNAMIITPLGTTTGSLMPVLSSDGYPVVAGYAATTATAIRSLQPTAYVVRPAPIVLARGYFPQQKADGGDAGKAIIAGSNTTVIDGTLQANPLPGFSGGSIALSAANVIIQQSASATSLPPDFGFQTSLAAVAGGSLQGKLTIAAPSLSGKGFKTIGIGYSNLDDPANSVSASTVTLQPGAVLQAENVILAANNLITLESGAQVLALAAPGETGQARLISPSGKAVIGPNALVRASDAVNLQSGSLDLQGTLLSDHSALDLKGSTITFVPDGYTRSSSDTGLFLTPSQWASLGNTFEDIALSSASDLVFNGTFGLSVKNSLTVDARRLIDIAAGSAVALEAQTITLQNTGAAPPAPGAARTSQITLTAQEMQVGKGNILLDSFSTINLNAQKNLTFRGVGTMTTGGGDLNISTSRLTTSYYLEPVNSSVPPVYTAANFAINAGTGKVTIGAGGGAPGTASTPGGSLAITAKGIDISTLIQIPSGRLTLTSSGDITLRSGAQLLLPGTDSAPGGVVSMMTTNGGAISLGAGSLINVSAGGQGDAGAVNLYAPSGGVALAGTLLGQAAAGGRGGSLSLVTSTMNDFGSFNQRLAGGGFNESLNIEASLDDIAIPAGQTVKARNLKITADAGSINLSGTIDVSQSDKGGTAELYAQQNLSVSGTIVARGTSGGEVTLGTSMGILTLNGGSIDVSGSGTGAGGTATFRAPLTGAAYNQLNMSLAGTVTGASSVVAEADRVYTNQYPQITQAVINSIQSDVSTFMNNYSGALKTQLLTNLTGVDPTSFHLQPGVIIQQTTGDITLSQSWDLTNWRWSGEPGTLTLRAAGNLYIQGNITDSPLVAGSTSADLNYMYLLKSTAMPSWGINLVAGAQTGSADLLAVVPQDIRGTATGNLFVGTATQGQVVYTQTGRLRFASGGDTIVHDSPTDNNFMIVSGEGTEQMPYSLATYAGNIRGSVGGSLVLSRYAAIQSATGDIEIRVGRDLDLIGRGSSNDPDQNLGAIRTTGERRTITGSGPYVDYQADAAGRLILDSVGNPIPKPYKYLDYFSFHDGGDIALDVGGNVIGTLNPNAWLYSVRPITTAQGIRYYPLTASFSQVAGQSQEVTQGIVTMAGGSVSIRAGGNFDNVQTGTFGEGNLRVYSGGNMTGRFLVMQGTADLSAMGNFGVPTQRIGGVGGVIESIPQLIEMGASQVRVSAQGNVEVGAIVNPNLAEAASSNYWDNGYMQSSSISLAAATGDVNIYNHVDSGKYGYLTGTDYLPPSVQISAGRDIVVMVSQTQLPAQDGTLSMQAGRDVRFETGVVWVMSDADPNAVYPGHPTLSIPPPSFVNSSHASTPVHTGDSSPVIVSAGRDLSDVNLVVPKSATITAGGNIIDLSYTGQNVAPEDVTRIAASGKIVFGESATTATEAIVVGGPGYIVVQAGGKIDLGYSDGIQAIGNYANPYIGEAGSSLVVAAGLSRQLSPRDVSGFFESLRSVGNDYSSRQASRDTPGAQSAIDRARSGIIAPFLGPQNTGGDIAMTSSQISTTGGGSLSVVATGALNVGTTVLKSANNYPKQTGILTQTGGAISVFTKGDVNVNEARMMTFQGGDITVWSDQGNINAGTGNKAAINASKPQYICQNGFCSIKFSPPAVGSGIRALTYAPADNVAPPPPGDIYLFAPQGIIDAGEAGISGKNVILGAVTVLNVQNISFSAGSVGVPAQSQSVNLGALTGTSNLAPKSTVTEETGGLTTKSRSVAEATQPIEDIVMKWLDIKVIDFDLSRGVVGEEEPKK